MSPWQSLYEAPAQLSSDWGHHRIYAPESYPSIRALQAVPIGMGEAELLARYFPICWRKNDSRVTLVALLSLRPESQHLPPHRDLPMALQAYPFVVPTAETIRERTLFVDKVFPDKPTDIGAPLVMDDGKLSGAAFSRAQLALNLASGASTTENLSEFLLTRNLLEPWPLSFDLGHGESVKYEDYMVIAAGRLSDPAMFALVEQFGVQAGLFMGYHRISLFRINQLLMQARAKVKAEKANPDKLMDLPL